MKKRRTDRELADDIVALLESDEDKARHPDMNVRSLLQRAKDAGGGSLRMQYLQQAQREIAKLNPSRHGRLISQLQAEVLALQGRRGDTKVAHVTPGEVVIPTHLQTPELMAALRTAAQQAGIDASRLVVGSRRNAINPSTGQAEFFDNGMGQMTVAVPRLGPKGINDLTATNPTYSTFAFDPQGPKQWPMALRHPIDAFRGWRASNQAYTETEERFPSTPEVRRGQNDAADAYRHARWNQLMTQSVGSDRAKQFADAHEVSKPNDDGERLMDLHNNQVGRSLVNGGPEAVEDALKKGLLRKYPFNTEW